MKNIRTKKLYGIGINDADYVVKIQESYYVEGKRHRKTTWECPYYVKWKGILSRCYSEQHIERKPTYALCFICKEWLTFSNFKYWMEQQDYEGKALDKDLLVYQNKVYSPATCVFVDTEINNFLCLCDARRGDYPIGVSDQRNTTKYRARIYTGNKQTLLGYFNTPEEAHRAWQVAKITYGETLIAKQKDPVIISGLQRAINKIKEDYNQNIETKDF